jgi:hypothetical protein
MFQRITGRCPECGADTQLVARACAACGASNASLRRLGLGLAIAIALIVIAAGGTRVWYELTAWRDANLTRMQNAPSLFGPPAPHARSNPTADFAWIERAMTDCEGEAIKHLDALYFLVTPLTAVDNNIQRWSQHALGQIGDSITLLASKDALSGLRDGTLALYLGQFVFSIIEPTSNVTYQWKPAVGVTEFVTAEAVSIKSFKPGLRLIGASRDTLWANSSATPRPACFWITALLRT